MSRINVATLMGDKELNSILINLETRNPKMLSHARAVGMDEDAVERASASIEALGEELVIAFSQGHDGRRSSILAHSPHLGRMLIHPVAHRMMEEFGIDAIDIAMLSQWSWRCIHGELAHGNSISFFYQENDDQGGASIYLGEHTLWEHEDDGSHSIETKYQIPETLKGRMGGMALRDVVSHPVLDPLNLRILRTENCKQNESLILHLESIPLKPLDSIA